MNLSKNFTFSLITAAVAIGVSFPLYAAPTSTTDRMASEPAANVSQTTKVVSSKTTMRMVKHPAHHSKSKTSKMAEEQQTRVDGGVLWKNGVVFHDVEPTGQPQNTPFGAPHSTSDTLEGGVTSTISPAPTP